MFNSFIMGGFEGADHTNANQEKLDMVHGSGHDVNVKQDYEMLANLGIKTIRESVGWRVSQPSIDSPLDLSRAILFAEEAQKHDIQIIWTFMHYGTPDGVDLMDDSFIEYFTEYAKQVATTLARFSPAPIFNLINEISFLAWATSQTDMIYPYNGDGNSNKGFETKCRLVKAVLNAMAEVKKIIPSARFIHIEPLMHFVPPADRPDLQDRADEIRSYQWQTFDLLKGVLCPSIGGHPEALDIMGVNYYYNCQMEIETDLALCWKTDERKIPLGNLLWEVKGRYNRPLIISETGHFDDDRESWLDDVFDQIQGAPIDGVCIYPVLDRPCWHEPQKITRTGVISITDDGHVYHAGSVNAIQRLLDERKMK